MFVKVQVRLYNIISALLYTLLQDVIKIAFGLGLAIRSLQQTDENLSIDRLVDRLVRPDESGSVESGRTHCQIFNFECTPSCYSWSRSSISVNCDQLLSSGPRRQTSIFGILSLPCSAGRDGTFPKIVVGFCGTISTKVSLRNSVARSILQWTNHVIHTLVRVWI